MTQTPSNANADPSGPDSPFTLEFPAVLCRIRTERRCRDAARCFLDVTDLLEEARRRGSDVRFRRCCTPLPVPPAIATCVRRVLGLALVAFRPPTSRRVDVHVCHRDGQLALQVTATDRHSCRRLLASEHVAVARDELSTWLQAFAHVSSLQPLRGDRANLAIVVPFAPASGTSWPGFGHLPLERGTWRRRH